MINKQHLSTSEKPTVLVVEDNSDDRYFVRSTLEPYCMITEVSTIEEATAVLQKNSFALIILDGSLPDGDGFKFCQKLRQEKGVYIPIILLTGRTEIDQRVGGFAVGADDYVVKPFEPNEFVARVQSKLKLKGSAGLQTSFVKGKFHVDIITQRITIIGDGQTKGPLNLTPIESKLMIHFLQNEGRIFSRQELVETIWGESTHVSTHTVDTHISSLRKKIGQEAKCIRAVLKKGYCFEIEEIKTPES